MNELDRWKATGLRSFLLYTGSIALKGILSSSYYKDLLSPFWSIRIFFDENEMNRNVFLDENGVVIIQSKLHNGDFVCDFYHKILLEDFFDTFIPS